MYRDLAENKASFVSSSPSIFKKVEAYYPDALRTIWKSDDTRDWKVYEKEIRFVHNWEGF